MSVNKAILLGFIGADPEIRYPEKDHPVAYMSLATNELQSDGRTEITEWHNLVMWGKNATVAERYVRKGTRLYVEGRLRSREYVDRLNISRRRTEIWVDFFEILGRTQ
ncbi:MAG: single-stranded DNA-binding protein [Muribaculaceae bacterium]|nr:single-stranded DNA-binding protein [Muribaculaceae bacterium]